MKMFFKQRLLCFLAVAAIGTAAEAQDVRLVAENSRDALSDASLLRQLEDDAAPQDYIAAARADYRRLLTALYDNGYYGGTISIRIDGKEAADLSPLAAPASINSVVIRVDAGPRFKFGRAEIAPLPADATLPESFANGRTARSARIERAVSAGLNSWRDLGYAKVRVSGQQIVARHDAKRLDVRVTVETGPRLTFGPLSISGNEDVRTKRIREIAGLPVGEVYSPAEIDAAERRLRRTGAFDSVAFREASDIGPGNTLPIAAQLVESKPRRIGFGLELSSIEGVTVSSFWLHRNLLGGAERFRVDGEVSGISGQTGGTDYRLRGTFNRPATFGTDTDFFIRGTVSREDEPDYKLDKIAVETGFSRILSDDLTVELAVGLLRAREETDIGNRAYTLLTLPLKATLDRRDEPNNAIDGYYLDLSATPFISTDGQITGARLYADARAYQQFGKKLTFAARGQLGSVLGASLDEAPADFLFYSGGGGTVRGQGYQSLDVERAIGGETVSSGGASFAGAQLEARVAATDSLSVVGFYDIGYLGEGSTPFEDSEWHAGAGIGLRYNTGIGPIRLDVGTPVGDDDAGEKVQVYIGIGQAF